MLHLRSRWAWKPQTPPVRVAVASDGAALCCDSRGAVTLLSPAGSPSWTRQEEEVRSIALSDDGRSACVLTAREVIRFGMTGKPLWRVAAPPLPGMIALRRDAAALGVAADQGLVRLLDPTGREKLAHRVFHHADFVALAERGEATAMVATSRRGDVSIIDPTATSVWHQNLACETWRPEVSRERIAVPSVDGVYAFAPDGTAAGVYDVGAPTLRACFGHQGATLLVMDDKRRLLLVEVATGNTLWHTELAEEVADLSFSWDGRWLVTATQARGVEALELFDDARASAPPPDPAPRPQAARPARGFLEVEPDRVEIQPRARWRAKLPAMEAPTLAVLSRGAGVALLDRAAGTVTLWTGGETPAWRVEGLGRYPFLGASQIGNPVVVAGEQETRFFSLEGAQTGRAAVAARRLLVAESGLAVLVGSASQRLHLYDAVGTPLWDVPTPGFDDLALSPRGHEIALARNDGTVTFKVRGGAATGWSANLPGHDPRILAFADVLLWGLKEGRCGVLSAEGGATLFESELPGKRGVLGMVRCGDGAIVTDAAGASFRLARNPWRVEPIPSGRGTRLFAPWLDRVVEFRYDAKEIASLDAMAGRVLWRRAFDEAPRAVAITADGSSLAAVVAGELVLYDLSPPEDIAPAEPRFLEL